MSEYQRPPKTRPTFPKRAVITGGMPYGNKSLHFGHIGGVFIHADVFARFLRDRLGAENVIFVSGTDCYGSPIVEHHRKLCLDGYSKSLVEFVQDNHDLQVKTLDAYQVLPNRFAASGLGRAAEIHQEISAEIFETLLSNGHLQKLETRQFYDATHEVYLNGRQVIGRCPIDGCRSEKGYADECDLGHQYQPHELLNPVSALSQTKPEMRSIVNWYLDLPKFLAPLQEWVEHANALPGSRRPAIASIREFFGAPVIHIVKKQLEELEAIRPQLPQHSFEDSSKKSVTLEFSTLDDRENACDVLSANGIQYRTGKTLVPFRLSGNIDWGVPVPAHEGLDDLTFWVWPESLWAPISFTATHLEAIGKDKSEWKDWWCSPDSQVYQFIGEDNVYFYGPAEMALFMGMQGTEFSAQPKAGQLQLPDLIVNRHLLFLNSKASSSGKIKPPMADELLQHYSPAQLRAHFISLGLGSKNISFQPKPYNPSAPENAPDPVEKEGKLLTNIFNRVIWKLVDIVHAEHKSQLPTGAPSAEIVAQTEEAIIDYEIAMHTKQFHRALKTADGYLRSLNKLWSAAERNRSEDESAFEQALVDALHMLRFSLLFMHPITPMACDRIRGVLGLSHDLWDWSKIDIPLKDLWLSPNSQILPIEKEEDFFA